MADKKKKAAEGESVKDTNATDKAAGKKAAPPEATAKSAPRIKTPKLAPKNKSRLPRREKKALKKAAAARQA